MIVGENIGRGTPTYLTQVDRCVWSMLGCTGMLSWYKREPVLTINNQQSTINNQQSALNNRKDDGST